MKVKKAFNPFEHRRLFFMGGLVIAMALVQLAFQWNGPELPEKERWITEVDLTNFIEVMVHTDEPELIVEAEPDAVKEPEPEPEVSSTIKVVDNKKVVVKTTTIRSIDKEPIKIKQVSIRLPEEKKEDKAIYDFAEVEPSFPGGVQAMYNWLSKQVKYPKFAAESNVEGTVWVSFIINKQGEVSDINILRSVGYGCDEQVIDAVSKMPKWSPGMQGGQEVNVRYKMPFTFKQK